MRILTIVGARPQFVKAAAVSRVIREKVEEILVHTGQHYDQNMSDIFFEELNIPRPDYNLGIGSGSHAKQTAEMMIKIEELILSQKPDYVMVYGDTNSTLAGALAAVKIHVPIIHIEAGLRSYNMNMPEEINRILTDRVSEYLLCPTDEAVSNLRKEGIINNVINVGDVMCDAVMYYGKKIDEQPYSYYFDRLIPLFGEKRVPDTWYMATIHRAENTDSIDKIENILNAFERLDSNVIFPVHPRTKGLVKQLVDKNCYKNIYFVEPVGYIDMLFFTKNAKKVVTDSGGLQKEAYILRIPCITVREQTEWVETLIGNHNILAHPITDDILDKVNNTVIDNAKYAHYYGDGNAANKILNIIIGDNK